MCAVHVLPLNLFLCLLVFVKSVNRACFKYICDQDEKGLDKVLERLGVVSDRMF
jgi:hypothetical protein